MVLLDAMITNAFVLKPFCRRTVRIVTPVLCFAFGSLRATVNSVPPGTVLINIGS
jgi:hypothetical protein